MDPHLDIQHLKYAVEVERCGSISRAAEALFVSQPFLSKAVRELEGELGLELFNRSPRGVVPTKRGADFLAHAKEIISSMDELENRFSPRRRTGYEFELCVPIACYISHAFVRFVQALDAGADLHANYRETTTINAISHVENHDCNIGIIRYPVSSDGYFQRHLAGRDIVSHTIWDFDYHLVLPRSSPLAARERIRPEDLEGLVEISHGDPIAPVTVGSEAGGGGERRTRGIVVYERQSQFELLSAMPDTYMWASPTPKHVLETYPLLERSCPRPDGRCRDVLIYRRGYHLTQTDRLFIEKVDETVRELSE